MLVLVRASEEEIRQWQAMEAERKRDAIVKAAGAHHLHSHCSSYGFADRLSVFPSAGADPAFP